MSETRELPTGWVWAKLSDTGRWSGGGTPSKSESSFWTGSIPWVSPKDMKTFRILDTEDHLSASALERTVVKLCPAGSVLVVVRSGILQRTLPVAMADVDVTLNQDMKAIIPHCGIESMYLAYYLISNEREILDNCSKDGTTVASIESERLQSYPIPLAPLPEQRRIVAAIEQQFTRLDAGVAALRRARAALKRYRAAVLKAAVEGRLTERWRAERLAAVGAMGGGPAGDGPAVETAPEVGLWPTRNPPTRVKRDGVGVAVESGEVLLGRILGERRLRWEADLRARGKDPAKARYEEPERPDVGSLPELPEGWCWATVEQVGAVQLGRQRAPQHHTGEHMRPYLRVANVFEDRIDTSDVLWMNFTPEEYKTYQLHYGDILLNEGQSLELVGRPAMYRDEVPGACFQNTLVRFRAYEGVLPEFALSLFRAYLHSKRFQRIGKHTTNIAHLGAGRFAEVEFPLPTFAEQEQIVAEVERRLSVVGELEATVEANLKRAERLRQSILREAFAGRLVAQDASDEPAGVLVERIREEQRGRAAAGGGRAVETGSGEPAVETAPEVGYRRRETRLRGLTEGKREVEVVGQVGLWGDEDM